MTQSEVFTGQDITHIATQLNAEIDLPFVPETMEQIWIEWVLRKAMTVVSLRVLQFIADAADGLTDEEIARYEVELTDMINKVVDIPMVPEAVEAAIIRPVVRQFLMYAARGKALSLHVKA